jgi:hypothetical protein
MGILRVPVSQGGCEDYRTGTEQAQHVYPHVTTIYLEDSANRTGRALGSHSSMAQKIQTVYVPLRDYMRSSRGTVVKVLYKRGSQRNTPNGARGKNSL